MKTETNTKTPEQFSVRRYHNTHVEMNKRDFQLDGRSASEIIMAASHALQEVTDRGWMLDPDRKMEVAASDSHSDYFMRGKVFVVIEIPVLLTAMQAIDYDIEQVRKARREAEGFSSFLALSCRLSRLMFQRAVIEAEAGAQ